MHIVIDVKLDILLCLLPNMLLLEYSIPGSSSLTRFTQSFNAPDAIDLAFGMLIDVKFEQPANAAVFTLYMLPEKLNDPE